MHHYHTCHECKKQMRCANNSCGKSALILCSDCRHEANKGR